MLKKTESIRLTIRVDAKVIQQTERRSPNCKRKRTKTNVDGGYTGKSRSSYSFIKSLLDQGLTPVISPVTGENLNFKRRWDRAAACCRRSEDRYYSLQMLTVC